MTAVTTALALSHRPDLLVDLTLPPTNRAALGPIPERWPIQGEYTHFRAKNGIVEFAVDKPFRVAYYGQGRGKDGRRLTVTAPRLGQLRFQRHRNLQLGMPRTWGAFKNKLILRRRQGADPPSRLMIQMPMATAAERDLNLETSGRTPNAFALRTLPITKTREHGLYLPAPGSAVFRIEVPENGQLRTQAHLLRPAIDQGYASDGATVVVTIDDPSAPVEVARTVLVPGAQVGLEADLSGFSGQTIDLRFTTVPGDSVDLDYVFLVDPVVYTPSDHPQRLLFVFVDTLRADHLGTYGYSRPTSPNIDGFALSAAVFDQARAPAPWTLPSSLAALYGRTPEAAQQSAHLGERLGRAGWATCAVVSNVWLTDPDTLATGWTKHQGTPMANAARQVRNASRCMADHADRDVFLFVHMIDPHVPYTEQQRYRGLFAGSPPPGLEGRIANKQKVLQAYEKAENEAGRKAMRQYLNGRYDQNILAVDDAFGDLLDLVGPDAVIALAADHGEEILDRENFGHGHSLFDEQVRVPLLIQAPGLPTGRIQVPVGLMDIAPTLLDLLGLPPLEAAATGTHGWSLIDLVRGSAEAEARFSARPLPMGRLFREDDQWGVVLGEHKWIAHGSRTSIFDLQDDPKELDNLAGSPRAPSTDFSARLADGLNRPVGRVLRIVGPGRHREMAGNGSALVVRHPAGVVAAWARIDARDEYVVPEIADGIASIPWVPGRKTPREIFVQLPDGVSPLGLTVSRATSASTVTVTLAELPTDSRDPLLSAGDETSGFEVTWAWQPLPEVGGGIEVQGEITAELRALGYVE